MQPSRYAIFLLIAFALMATCAHAVTTNVNTKNELTAAIAAANPGDNIVIENGTYTNWGQVTIPFTSDCTASQRCTLTVQTEGSVVFSGQGALTLDIRSRYWTISKIKWQNQTSFGNYSTPTPSSTGPLIVFDGAQDSIVDDVTMQNLSGTGVVIAVMKLNGTRDTLRNTVQNSLFNGWNQTASGSTFFYILSRSERGYNTYFNILNNQFLNRTTSSSSNSQYWIRYGNGHFSVYTDGNNITGANPRYSHVIIRGNTFKNDTLGSNGQDVMHMKWSGGVVDGNYFENTTRVLFRSGRDNQYINNIVKNPNTTRSSYSFWVADVGNIIANNLFFTTRGDRTAIGLSRGTTDSDHDNDVDYKEFHGSIYHNTFDGFTNYAIRTDGPATGNNEGPASVNPTIINFQNNVVRQQQGTIISGSSCGSLFSGNVDHNAWSGSATAGCITQSGTGDVLSAPQWVNPAGGDYHLQDTSPLRNAGVSVSGAPIVNLDIEGNQRDSSPDIGAYEYGGAAPPSSTCDDIFGSATDYLLCDETSTTCKFNATLNGSDCDTLCGSFGKTCVAAYGNASNSCVENATITCATAQTDTICECEIQDAPPPPPSTGTFYVDASCGTQGNGLTTTCGTNGPWTSLKYALETVDCAGMVAGDVLEVRGMTTTPSAGNWYTDNHTDYPTSSIAVDSACSGISVRLYSGATENVVVDGSVDLHTLSWSSLGSGVYESAATTLTTWPHRAWYKRGANSEETLSLIQSVRTCTTALATNYMRYNPVTKTVCAHLSDGSSPAAATYFRVPSAVKAFDFTTEDVDDFTIEASGATFLITRFADTLIDLSTGTNQNITISALTLSEALNGIIADGGPGLGDYNITGNSIDNIGEVAIKIFDYLGSPTIIGNTIDGVGISPNFEKCSGVGAGCQTGYSTDARGIWLNNCVTRDDVTRATVQDNVINDVGEGWSGFSYGIHSDDCTHANLIDSNLLTNSTANSQTGYRGIFFSGIPAGQYHDHDQITNNRCEAVDFCIDFDYDTNTDQTGMRNFVYGNSCSNPNTTCVRHESNPNIGGELWFKDNLLSTDDGDGVLLLNVPSSTMWTSSQFSNNAFECDHANCSGATIATWQGSNYKRDGDCTPSTDCIADIGNNNIYGACNVTATSLDLPAGSACIDAGVNLSLLPTDYKKIARPFGVTSDIGAHEYDGSTPTTDLTQAAFRYYDRFTGDAVAPLAAENKTARFYAHSQFNLRFAITGDAGTDSHLAEFALYYQHCSPSCGSYTQITPTCAGNPACLVDHPTREDGDAISNDLSLGGRTYLAESAFYELAEDGIHATIAGGDQLELEFSVGMGSTVSLGDLLNFRVYRADGTALNAYSQTPSLTVGPILGTIFQAQ